MKYSYERNCRLWFIIYECLSEGWYCPWIFRKNGQRGYHNARDLFIGSLPSWRSLDLISRRVFTRQSPNHTWLSTLVPSRGAVVLLGILTTYKIENRQRWLCSSTFFVYQQRLDLPEASPPGSQIWTKVCVKSAVSTTNTIYNFSLQAFLLLHTSSLSRSAVNNESLPKLIRNAVWQRPLTPTNICAICQAAWLVWFMSKIELSRRFTSPLSFQMITQGDRLHV